MLANLGFSPGRFYATFAIKLIMSHLLLNYEIKTNEPKERYFTWRSVNVPREDMKLWLKAL